MRAKLPNGSPLIRTARSVLSVTPYKAHLRSTTSIQVRLTGRSFVLSQPLISICGERAHRCRECTRVLVLGARRFGPYPVRRKPNIAVITSGALLVGALILVRFGTRDLPRIPLRDGGEVRVIQVRYTPGPSDSIDHNIDAPKFRWWMYRLLPSSIRQRVGEPTLGIGNQASDRPVLSVWWAHFDSTTHKPMLGEAGDVLMTTDSGEQTNLGWPDPAEDYRQIFVTDPPTNSKRLIFEFPVWGEPVRFSISNPAYRR